MIRAAQGEHPGTQGSVVSPDMFARIGGIDMNCVSPAVEEDRQKRGAAIWICLLAVVFFAGNVFAQEFRGSITGLVTDPSGAVIAGARVTVTNVATNTLTSTISGGNGNYTLLYLTPGRYTVTAEAAGFKKLVRQGIEVRIADRIELDLRLELGATQDTVTVTGETPLLETESASLGQVIDRRRISELPIADGNPFSLAQLAPGITFFDAAITDQRPFDNNGTSAVQADGAPGGNEYTLDGSPNMTRKRGGGQPVVAFVPPADAVQEFKIQTATFDAQQGHTAGASVNVLLKSGANQLHGTLYEFLRNDRLSANDFFLNRSGQPRAARRYNRYGGSAGGPVWIPRLYNGKDKSFFFVAFEGLRDVKPQPGYQTVPTPAEIKGDLSALTPAGVTIYDPASARLLSSGRIQRDPILNNIIPANRLSPIAAKYLTYYPAPNQPGDSQGRNNFFAPNTGRDYFHSESVRLDQTLTDKHRFFVRYTHNRRKQFGAIWTGIRNDIAPVADITYRVNNGATYDHVYTMTPRTVLNFRLGVTRFIEPNPRNADGIFNPADLGFSPQTIAYFQGALYFPRFNMSNYSNLGNNMGSKPTYTVYSLQPTLTKIMGSHTVRLGYDARAYRQNNISPGHPAGYYAFDSTYTRGPLDNSSAAPIGQELAALLLGQPGASSYIDRNVSSANQTPDHAFFFQDDWKVARRLTLNAGVRYEYEGATTERYNRNVRGFDRTSSSPIEAAAKKAYAASAIPQISADAFRVVGGLLFADSSHRGFWNPDLNNIQPRVGFAYQISKKTVLRGGWGIYAVPFDIDGVNQSGFSQSTSLVPSLDNGLTFRANLYNPFPDGVTDPPGSKLGLATYLGQTLGSSSSPVAPVDRRNGQTQRVQVDLQRELPGNWLVEAGYVGSYGYDLTVGGPAGMSRSADTLNVNPVPAQYLSTSPVRDTTTINLLTAQVTNPFLGLLPGSSNNGATIQRQQLLKPYPQFVDVNTQRHDGSTRYHSAQFRLEKRFSRGYTLTAGYTKSRLREKRSLLNATDTAYEDRVAPNDRPNRFVISGIFELPFGRGRKLGKNWKGVTEAVAGGWQVQGLWIAQSGAPLALGNIYYSGDPGKLNTHIDGSTVDNAFDSSGFYFSDAAVTRSGQVDPALQRSDSRISLASNIRTLPTYVAGFRGAAMNQGDLSVSKYFSCSERVKLQLRGEFLNAFNHPQFNDPNLSPSNSAFGKITSQANLPRSVQLALKLSF